MNLSFSLISSERCEQIVHFWGKNEQFAWKTDERIPSPANTHIGMKEEININIVITNLS